MLGKGFGRVKRFFCVDAGKILLISAIAIFVLLASAEVFLRIEHKKFVQEEDRKTGGNACTMKSKNPELIYELAPGKCGHNSQGFWDEEHEFGKPDNTYRIALIGDSVAQGMGLKHYNQSFGKLLQGKLNDKSGSVRFEVILLAVPGYTTEQELEILRKRTFRYKPDLILWSYVLNDAEKAVYHNTGKGLGRYYYRPQSFAVHEIRKWLFFRRWNQVMELCGREYHTLLHQNDWRGFVWRMAEIKRVSRRKNATVAFMIHPIFQNNDFDDYPFLWLHQKIGREAVLNKMHVYDILDAYENHTSDELRIPTDDWYDPWHSNERGHELIADYLYENLIVDIPGIRDAAVS